MRIGRPYLKSLSLEEIESTGFSVVAKVIAVFDSSKGVPFVAYLTNCLKHGFVDSIRSIKGREFQKPETTSIVSSEGDHLIDSISIEYPYNDLLDSLNAKERRIAESIMNKQGINELAGELRIKPSKVSRMRKIAAKRLKILNMSR